MITQKELRLLLRLKTKIDRLKILEEKVMLKEQELAEALLNDSPVEEGDLKIALKVIYDDARVDLIQAFRDFVERHTNVQWSKAFGEARKNAAQDKKPKYEITVKKK